MSIFDSFKKKESKRETVQAKEQPDENASIPYGINEQTNAEYITGEDSERKRRIYPETE